ncbi:MAG: phage tail tape measure protein, partial [Candidatus Moranbacteria bacterium]|nr:phage tail tape measure protein [Candidatus Moranbacteria bacterium]
VVQTGQITDIFANAITKSKLSTDMLITAFGYVGAAGSQAGLTLEEVSGTLMVLADNGIRASTMGTALRKTLLSMLAPNTALKTALFEVGMSISDINPGLVGYEQALKNLAPLVWDFEQGTVDMAKAQAFFGIRASQVAAILIRETAQGGGISRAIESTKELGAALRMAEKQQEGLGVKFKNLGDTIKNVALAIGEAGLNNALHNLVDSLKTAATAIENFVKAVPIIQLAGWVATFTSISLAIYAIGRAIEWTLPFLKAFSATMVLNPWGAALTAIVALSTAYLALRPNIKNTTDAFQKQAVIMKESVTTLEGWIRVLNEAEKKGAAFYNTALVRYATENKELANELVNVINKHDLLNGQMVTSLEEVIALSKGFEDYAETVKKANELLLFEKAKESFENFKQGFIQSLQELKEKAEDAAISEIIIQPTSNRAEAIAAAREYAKAIQDVRDSIKLNVTDIQHFINDLGRELYDFAKNSPNLNEAIIAELEELKKVLSPEIFGALVRQIFSIMESEAKKGAAISPLIKLFEDIPKEVQKIVSKIHIIDMIEFEKQKADLMKKYQELAANLKNKHGEISESLEASLKTRYFADLKNLAEGFLDTGEKAKTAATEIDKVRESLDNLGLSATLEKFPLFDFDKVVDSAKVATQISAETSAQFWKERHEEAYALQVQMSEYSASKIADIHKAHTDKIIKDRDDAEERARKERERKEREAAQKIAKEWERVYDDMHKFAADTFYDIFDGQLDSFEDFTDEMLNIFKRMLANMVAEAAMTNIFKPLMNSMAGSMMGNMFGLPSAGGGSTMMFPSFGG